MTAPLPTTRDRLAEALWDRWWATHASGHDVPWSEISPRERERYRADADALLASGAVVDVATLAEDEALVGRIAAWAWNDPSDRGFCYRTLAALAAELGSA